jgi:hypothetical protein
VKSGRARRTWIVLAVACVLIVGVVAGFAIGRSTKSSSDSAMAVTGLGPRTGIDLTGAKGLSTSADTGWFSEPSYSPPPNLDARPGRAIKIYAAPTGGKVIAWLYEDCSMPEGIVAPNRKPATCEDGRTTSATAGATVP